MTEVVELPPYDTAHIRRLLAPCMRRNEKHTGLFGGPNEEAFLDDLIKTGLIHILPELEAFRDGYLAHLDTRASAPNGPGAGTTPSNSAPSGDPAPAPSFPRPEDFAALPARHFRDAAFALPPEELQRLTTPPEDDVDVFDTEQRVIIEQVLHGKAQHADEFDIEAPDPTPKPGDILEHNGRAVRVLMLAADPGMVRVAYLDPSMRRDETLDNAPSHVDDDLPPAPDLLCPHCDHPIFQSKAAKLSHVRAKHPAPTSG